MKKLLLLLAVATMTVGLSGCACGQLRSWFNDDRCDAPACGTPCCQAPMSGCGEAGGVIMSPPMISPGPIVQ